MGLDRWHGYPGLGGDNRCLDKGWLAISLVVCHTSCVAVRLDRRNCRISEFAAGPLVPSREGSSRRGANSVREQSGGSGLLYLHDDEGHVLSAPVRDSRFCFSVRV